MHCVPNPHSRSNSTTKETTNLVTAEVAELLSKEETHLSPNNYVSQKFLKDRGQRPVINLKGLSQLVKEDFKMEGFHQETGWSR